MAELSIELPSNVRFDSLESALAGDTFLDVFYGNDLGSGAPAFSDLPLDLPASYSPQGYSSPSHPSVDGVSTSEDDSSSLHRPAIKNERPLVEKFDIHSLQEHARKRCLDDKVLVSASASSSSNPPSPLCETDRQQKRQKRLLKNRESAQLSRQRKKMHMDELEAKVAELTTETEYLSRENEHLRTEVNELRGKLGLPAIELPPRRQTTLSNSKAAKAAGICLLVLLFSFGLVMNAPAGQRLLMRSSASGGAVRTGRALQSVEDSSASAAEQPVAVPVVPAPPVEQHIVQSSTTPSPAAATSSASSSKQSQQPSSKRPLVPPANPDSSNHNLAPEDDAHSLVPVAGSKRPRNIRILDDDESASEAITIPTVKLQRDGSLVPVRDLSTEYQLIRQSRTSRHRPPSQYIYCSEAQQLHFDPQAASDGLPSVVALLIPSEFLNATAAPRNSLVEVTCSVMDMNAYPLYQPSNNSDDGSNAALQRT